MNNAPPSHGIRPATNVSKVEQLGNFLSDSRFPCVAAKSALNKKRMSFADYPSMHETWVAGDICERLKSFSDAYPDPGNLPVSFVAMFDDRLPDESSFELALWSLLQACHELDRKHFDWDPTVGSDPALSDFSFSVAGRAFFVVGLHPKASRLSRRAPFPCLVFNFHDQFESLKHSGKYESMQAAIRERDLRLQGSLNPVLDRFGEASEARQYAGRAVDRDWRCPFRAKEHGHA